MSSDALALVPRPTSVHQQDGTYVLPTDLAVDASPAWAAVARRLLGPGTGLDLPLAADGALRLVEDPALTEEAYRLDVTATGITITAATEQGVNWAVQTLRQLLPPDVLRAAPSGVALTVPLVSVADEPRFGWRGVMVDVGRHFLPLSDLFRVVDLLALHKYNVLHLHLTEDQGWRFPSAAHPRLQTVASWRTETRKQWDAQGDGTPHGGFYTLDQLRAVVAYAGQRGLTVVPEIDLPGHALALLAAYPELGNHPETGYAPATGFGVFDETLNLTDETVDVVLGLFGELLEVFPSRYVHVGGDEAPRTEWLASPAAQALAAERGLADATHLQRWFTERLRDFLAERGRQLVGWDEICDEGPLPGAVAMAWRGAEHGVAAAEAGLDVVMAPFSHTYLDFYPGEGDEEQYAIGGLTTTETVYGFEPLEGMTPECTSRVLGTQCQLWTEYVPTMRRAEYMLFPRACAHSEVAWSDAAGRSWAEFQPRLAGHLARLDALGVNFRPEAGPHPWQQGGTGTLRRPPEQPRRRAY
ncbi:beta-N-acetylhexosaminidase [Microlunatus antarcticus]|uniref:beta-N-acetylhexosaminidase n=1 Tax=Microlunatus antarcticus TaxID=53388 RepID=A0A7W5P8U4_9ACTN|nr:beta-N-acetylhexosaminidase [Microlunatus antarcticus]MBB3328940.1 hexosaminidase [Microlunatus antarcticus]